MSKNKDLTIENQKKVLLITLEGVSNYGNRLQHFALQTKIEKSGYQVTSLMVRGQLQNPAIEKIKLIIGTALLALGWRNKFCHRVARLRRRSKLRGFNRQHINDILYMPVDEVRCNSWDAFCCAVTGSDQVWHNWHEKTISDELSYYYLEFMPADKRVSYAPSFGFTAFPEDDLESHRRGLLGMQALSCREKEGCDLIYELTGRKAEKVLDPTLLLTAEEWEEKEKRPPFRVPEHYMLKFFLGTVSEEFQDELDRLSKEFKNEVIDLQDLNDPVYYGLSPLEFVWMIHHADVVCTDSFHASVFSILFQRNLRVFERISPQYGNMFGRLHDLLEPLGLMNNVYGIGNQTSTKLSIEAQNYLRRERERSLNYLCKSLKKA